MWEANNVRLILFPSEPLPLGVDLWRTIFGGDPETEETRPREGLRQQRGRFRQSDAVVAINPLRIDFALAPSQPDAAVMSLEMLGPNIVIGDFKSEMAAI